LISKPKFHFLLHIPDCIRRFGPAILVSTERYESFHTPTRATFIYSNSARTFSSQDIVKHITTGGFWFDKELGMWVQAGHAIAAHKKTHPEHLELLGVPTDDKHMPGSSIYSR
jgi:hypothetical protein